MCQSLYAGAFTEHTLHACSLPRACFWYISSLRKIYMHAKPALQLYISISVCMRVSTFVCRFAVDVSYSGYMCILATSAIFFAGRCYCPSPSQTRQTKIKMCKNTNTLDVCVSSSCRRILSINDICLGAGLLMCSEPGINGSAFF